MVPLRSKARNPFLQYVSSSINSTVCYYYFTTRLHSKNGMAQPTSLNISCKIFFTCLPKRPQWLLLCRNHKIWSYANSNLIQTINSKQQIPRPLWNQNTDLTKTLFLNSFYWLKRCLSFGLSESFPIIWPLILTSVFLAFCSGGILTEKREKTKQKMLQKHD